MTKPSFVGDWLVSEYVYTPAGEFAGVIHQRRQLESKDDVIRVVQHCEPVIVADNVSAQAQATIGIMNKRVGEFVFDLKIDGRARHYLGEDVIGGGFSWRDGVLTAKGLWPNFGYNFTSFSMLIYPNRQVTGGKFFNANEEVATIVGLATPEDEGYPVFEDGTISGTYQGKRYSISADGDEVEGIDIDASALTFSEKEGFQGNEKQYGALREVEAVTAPGQTISGIEIVDHASRSIAGIWKKYKDEKLNQVDIYFLNR